MTKIYDPYSQSAALYGTYINEGLLTENLNLLYQCFDNMPDIPVNKISSLSNSKTRIYIMQIYHQL